MDIATVIGLVASVGLIVWSMDNAAGINAFIDVTSIAIVLGGSILVLLMRSRLNDFIAMWSKVIMKTIFVGETNLPTLLSKSLKWQTSRARTD